MSAFAHFERVARRIIEQPFGYDGKAKRHGGHDGFVYMAEGHFSRVYHNVDYPGKVFKISGPSGFGHGSKNFYDRMWSAPGVPCPDVWPTFAEFCMSPEGREAPVVTVWGLERLDADYVIAEMPYCSEPRRQGVAGTFQREFDNAELNVSMPPDWAVKLVHIEKAHGFRRDIHSGNVLYDPSKKKDVLSDPWCSVPDRNVKAPTEDADRGLFNKVVVNKPRMNAGEMMDAIARPFGFDGKAIAQRFDEMMFQGIMDEMKAKDLKIEPWRLNPFKVEGKRADVMIFDDFMRHTAPRMLPPPPMQVEERRGPFFDPAPWKAKNKRKMFV